MSDKLTLATGQRFLDGNPVGRRSPLYIAIILWCTVALAPQLAGAQLVQTAKITSNDSNTKSFGGVMSVSGGKALIGASGATSLDPGKAYLYEQVEDVWTEAHEFTASVPEDLSGFGHAVSLSNNRAAIASFDGIAKELGVYIYDYIDNMWVETARLSPDDVDLINGFGTSVSLFDDRVLVGTQEIVDGIQNTGSVYVFDLIDEAWVQTAKIVSPAPPSAIGIGAAFGSSVSLDGDRALIGSSLETSIGGSDFAGAAYVFELEDGIWVQKTRLAGTDAAGVVFGLAVSLADEMALIGAPGEDAVYLFELNNDTWVQSTKFSQNDLTGTGFGVSLSALDNTIVIGAPTAENAIGETAGAAYVFSQADGTWSQTAKLTAEDGLSGDKLGLSVGIVNGQLLAGADAVDVDGVFLAGAVYVFGPADGDGDGYSDVDELACNSNPDDFYSVPSGTVSGTVATGSNGIAGITVKVLDALDPMIVLASGTTDAQGAYSFADVPQGDVQVMVVEPLGFSSAANNVDEAVACNATSTVDFSLDELILVNNAMRVSYWKHQFDLAVAGQPTAEDLTAIISEIQHRFTDPHFSSLFAGMGDGVDDEQDWQALFSIRPSGGTFARARAQLAGVVMNVMAQKIAQFEVVTDDGRHVADVITYAAQLLEDADAGNDGTAYTVAEQVNRQLSIGAGVVPAGNVVYGQEEGRSGPALDFEAVAVAVPEAFALENNYPNPFNPTTAIRFALPESAHVSLVVYNALGQTVARLVDGGYAAGHHEVQFDAGDLPSGTYLYRLETPAGSFTKTMLLLK